MTKLIIKWQRLVDKNGVTCKRCGNTGDELEKAFFRLREALGILGFQIELEQQTITIDDFKKDPLSSNMILINDKPLEEWLGGKTGKSTCCDVCGGFECRTLEIGNKVYEAIPASMIIKAGLVAAADSLPVGKRQAINILKEV